MSIQSRSACAYPLLVTLACLLLTTQAAFPRTLTFQERVSAQEALERISWSHRIWPAENAGPKPPLEQVMSATAIRAKVEDYLKKSEALERIWKRPVVGAQLQAEMERMARDTRRSDVLQEMFRALGNDPFLIAECLARPILVDRLIHSWYARDDRFHGRLRRRASSAVAEYGPSGLSKLQGVRSQEIIYQRKESSGSRSSEPADSMSLTEDEWNSLLRSGAVERQGTLQESEDGFFISRIMDETADRLRVQRVTWPKVPFDVWWESARSGFSVDPAPADDTTYQSVSARSSPCVDDTWRPTRQQAPDPRRAQTAVWTGSEMIVWGGTISEINSGGISVNTGGRYSPATDTWTSMADGDAAPAPRESHAAVWTGTEMIVWGGSVTVGGVTTYLNSGGRYDPVLDRWSPTNAGSACPPPRGKATALWTGNEMIVWGGTNGTPLQSGGRYKPSTDEWTATNMGVNVPAARVTHTAVWTGSEMIIWGGRSPAGLFNSGGRYNPSTDSWTPTQTGANVPSARRSHAAIWTGREMIVWGGNDGHDTNTGGRYDPLTDSWTPTSTGTNTPAARTIHTAIWTGNKMIVWGRTASSPQGNGAIYDPSSNTWSPMAASSIYQMASFTAVWTGTEMIVWGDLVFGQLRGLVSRYNFQTDSWLPPSVSGAVPEARWGHLALWTGSEMLVWGGISANSSQVNTGGLYDPATDSWRRMTQSGVPEPRSCPAVWTGREMIVWGGYGTGPNGGIRLNTGGRYDPATNTWRSTSVGANNPSARQDHSSVWTGTTMIVWGGRDGTIPFDTGGIYDPATDSWTPTGLGPNVPAARSEHVAVWTGRHMIVWGGSTDAHTTWLDTGGRYDPVSETWQPTSVGEECPPPGIGGTALWTGHEVIFWGSSATLCARYNPVSDAWSSCRPGPGYYQAAVWTGTEMIVWGGNAGAAHDAGARYDAAADTWSPTTLTNSPTGRYGHSAIWTGGEMIVWGGAPTTSSGGAYCAQCTSSTWFHDSDGDGVGLSSDSIVSCRAPAGYVASSGDCDDSNVTIHPGAIESCDGIDNDCDGVTDNAALPTPPLGLHVSSPLPGPSQITWDSSRGATSYDVVRGSLPALEESRGDFSVATQGCMASNVASTVIEDAATLVPGDGAFYLVRPRNCAGAGTYDTGLGSQTGSRDPGIQLSGVGCP